jgi:FkbM family methyltransferase
VIVPDLLEQNITLIDVGAVGNPPKHWLPLKEHIDLIGFEPNPKHCSILNSSNCEYSTAQFLPYAIGECDEEKIFHLTKYHECCSILEPNSEWLDRFEYGDFFKVEEQLNIKTKPLDGISEIQEKSIDAIKIDAQGYELPILIGARNILDEVFLLEVETGLHKNYINETTFEEISYFLKELNFMCMEIKQQPAQKRSNLASSWSISKGQAMACESIWVKDLRKFTKTDLKKINRNKLLSILSLGWLFNFSDLCLEILEIAEISSLLDEKEKRILKTEEYWLKSEKEIKDYPLLTRILCYGSYLIPTPNRRDLANLLPKLMKKPNFLKEIFENT